MKLIKTEEDLSKLLHRVQVIQARYEPWQIEAKLDTNYFYNRVFTEKDRDKLARRGQSDVSINRVYPIIEHQKSTLGTSKLGVRYIPTENGDDKLGQAINTLAQWVLTQSNFEDVMDKVIEHFLNMGVGYLYTYVDWNKSDGNGEVIVDYLHPLSVFWDLRAKKYDWSDANFCFIVRRFERTRLMQMHPKYAQKIAELDGSDSIFNEVQTQRDESYVTDNETIFDEDVLLTLVEYYQKVQVKYHRLVINGSNIVLPDKELQKELRQNPTLQALYKSGQVQDKVFWKTRIHAVTIVGEKLVIQDTLTDLEDFPVVPFVRHHDDTVFPLSEIRYLRPINDEINKLHMLMIAHTTKSTNMKVLYEHNQIDEKLWKDRAAIPGALLPYSPGLNGSKPEFVYPQPLNTGVFQMLESDKYDMEYLSGTYSYSQGSPQEGHDTFRGLLVLEEFANKRMGYKARRIHRGLRRFGRVLLRYMQAVYNYPKIIRLMGEDGEPVQLGINMMQIDDNGIPRFFNRIDNAEYDIIPEGGSLMPTNRMALAEFYMSLYEKGIVDAQAVRDHLELPDRTRIEQRLSQMQQMAEQNQQLQEQLKQTTNDMQKLQKQNTELQRKLAIEREITALRNEVVKAKEQVKSNTKGE